MDASRNRSRILIMALATLACAAPIVGVVLVATGRLCITSPQRPIDRYEGPLALSGADGSGAISDGIAISSDVPFDADATPDAVSGTLIDNLSAPDADSDGAPDNDDILTAALAYVQTRPHYKSVYYPSGYSDDEYGVCTDVAAIACRAAGYDLQALIAADVAMRPDAYAIEVPDSAIDFRRTPNLKVFFDQHAHRLTTDVSEVSEWRGGDIVLYDGHVGIVSNRRNAEGVPYLIHHSGPFQLRYEEDKLRSYGRIVGHYRVDRACLDLLS